MQQAAHPGHRVVDGQTETAAQGVGDQHAVDALLQAQFARHRHIVLASDAAERLLGIGQISQHRVAPGFGATQRNQRLEIDRHTALFHRIAQQLAKFPTQVIK